jgi:glycosyltransferase involved in cell wall biosynthesis
LLLRRHLRGDDMLILQRRMPSTASLAMLRSLVPRLVYDFDDAVFLRDSFHPEGPHCAKRARRFRGVVQAADAVIAGNAFLYAQASLWLDPARLHIIPTCLDSDRYPASDHARHVDAPELVWIGTASTLRSLAQFRPLLEEVGARVPGLRLKIICDEFLRLDRIEVVPCLWAEQTEAAELAGTQVGLSWLPDDLWSRGKCGLKVLQYMAAGLPVIANPVGLHRELVVPGVTGFLVETAGEFAAALSRLRADADLRRRLGQAGRALVRERFHIAHGAARWISLLHELPAPARRPVPNG